MRIPYGRHLKAVIEHLDSHQGVLPEQYDLNLEPGRRCSLKPGEPDHDLCLMGESETLLARGSPKGILEHDYGWRQANDEQRKPKLGEAEWDKGAMTTTWQDKTLNQ